MGRRRLCLGTKKKGNWGWFEMKGGCGDGATNKNMLSWDGDWVSNESNVILSKN